MLAGHAFTLDPRGFACMHALRPRADSRASVRRARSSAGADEPILTSDRQRYSTSVVSPFRSSTTSSWFEGDPASLRKNRRQRDAASAKADLTPALYRCRTLNWRRAGPRIPQRAHAALDGLYHQQPWLCGTIADWGGSFHQKS